MAVTLSTKSLICRWAALGPLDRAIAENWYKSARNKLEVISSNANITIEQCCGMAAVISPGLTWENNISSLIQVLHGLEEGVRGQTLPAVSPYTFQNVLKAEQIFLNKDKVREYVSGPKVLSFYFNLLHPNNPQYVTITKNAILAAHGKQEVSAKMLQLKDQAAYDQYADLYLAAAKELGIRANVLQAGMEAARSKVLQEVEKGLTRHAGHGIL